VIGTRREDAREGGRAQFSLTLYAAARPLWSRCTATVFVFRGVGAAAVSRRLPERVVAAHLLDPDGGVALDGGDRGLRLVVHALDRQVVLERRAALAEARVEDDDGLREVQRGDGEVLGVLALRAEALGRGVLSGPEKLLRDEGRVDLSLPAGQDLRADLRDGAHGRSHRRCHPHPWR
jgi:hypothetical protein